MGKNHKLPGTLWGPIANPRNRGEKKQKAGFAWDGRTRGESWDERKARTWAYFHLWPSKKKKKSKKKRGGSGANEKTRPRGALSTGGKKGGRPSCGGGRSGCGEGTSFGIKGPDKKKIRITSGRAFEGNLKNLPAPQKQKRGNPKPRSDGKMAGGGKRTGAKREKTTVNDRTLQTCHHFN